MSVRPHSSGRWLDLAVPAVPAAAAAWSAALVAPLFHVMAEAASPIAGLAIFLGGWWAMRSASARPEPFALRTFRPGELNELLLDQFAHQNDDDVMVLDRPLTGSIDALAELLLDDPLPMPSADSRVVQLFPAQPVPSAGELKRRIDLHLGRDSDGGEATIDAADSLRRALDELRQTLTAR